MKYSIRQSNEFEREKHGQDRIIRLTKHIKGKSEHSFFNSLERALWVIESGLDGLVHRGFPDGKESRCKDCCHIIEITAVDMIKNAYQDQVIYGNWCPKCNSFKDEKDAICPVCNTGPCMCGGQIR